MASGVLAIPELDAKGLRNFGLSTGAIIGVLFGLALPWIFDRAYPIWPWVLCGVLVLWALIAPKSLRLVYKYWMRFGLLLSRVTTPIVLGIVFFLIIAPVGIIRRVLGYDSMARALDDDITTYRVPSRETSKESLEKPY